MLKASFVAHRDDGEAPAVHLLLVGSHSTTSCSSACAGRNGRDGAENVQPSIARRARCTTTAHLPGSCSSRMAAQCGRGHLGWAEQIDIITRMASRAILGWKEHRRGRGNTRVGETAVAFRVTCTAGKRAGKRSATPGPKILALGPWGCSIHAQLASTDAEPAES